MSVKSGELRLIVTGGGTGGHTLPALAVVERVRQIVRDEFDGLDVKVLYIGSEHGLEVRLAKEADIDFVSIATGKLRRASNPLRMVSRQNLSDMFRVPLGFIQAFDRVRRFRPDVVFSTGGYVSVPTVLAAWAQGVPIIMHEQTVQVGLANRFSACLSTIIALSFAESAELLNESERRKCLITGSVVRPIVLSGDAEAARSRYRFGPETRDLPVVYITGGAQGASIINRAVLESLAELTTRCCIIHQCGRQKVGEKQDEDRLIEAAKLLPNNLRERYFVTPYVGDEIGDLYALADLIVGRSGAGTVSEVSAAGKAALFIPLVPTGGDEQTKNARRLERVGAAVMVEQSSLTGALLLATLMPLISSKNKLQEMGRAAKALFTPDADGKLSRAIIELGLKNRKK